MMRKGSMVNYQEIMDMMEPRRLPALHLVASEQTGRFSKIGGLPEVPAGFEWPLWKDRSLSFLAQIDLAEVENDTNLDDLPTTGKLYFFYDYEQETWGFDPKDRGSWRVFLLEETGDLQPLPVPKDADEYGAYYEKRVDFRKFAPYPSLERLDIDLKSIPDDDWDAIEDKLPEVYNDLPAHQLGGYPLVEQNDCMELECQLASNGLYVGDSSGYNDPRAKELENGADEWRLLLQLDTDDDTGMMWGDMGRLYFWIRASDLKERDFSQVWMVLQCG